MKGLLEFAQKKKFPVLQLNESFHRFNRDGTQNGWFWGTRKKTKAGTDIVVALMGDWKTGEKYEYKSFGNGSWSENEYTQVNKILEESRKRIEHQKGIVQKQVAQMAQKTFNLCSPGGKSLYLEKKKIPNLFGAKLDDGVLYIPMRDITNKLWGLQKILPNGSKYFCPGQKIKECFHVIESKEKTEKEERTIFIAEGFSTGAAIAMATNATTIIAFAATNLVPVTRVIREKYPKAKLIIGYDNDRWTKRQGNPYNPGHEKALEAARETGARLITPNFSSLDTKPTDWNDLLVLEGLDTVRDQLHSAISEAKQSIVPTSDLMGDIKKKTKKPAELFVVKTVMDDIGDRLIKQDRDLFQYSGKAWHLLKTSDLDKIRQKIQNVYGPTARSTDIESAMKTLVVNLPAAPTDMFTPNPYISTFNNGNLHLDPITNKLTLLPHDPNDFTTSILDFDYPQNPVEPGEFHKLLDRLFKTDKYGPDKIRAIQQMFGACLMPCYPHLFLLYGPPMTGKSTLILLASHLLHERNISRVEPTDFRGFLMEQMPGKLANIITDIDTKRFISDSIVKRIDDRVPIAINRKGKQIIYAPLPAIHILGANELPRTLDVTGAYKRRWTIIHMDSYKPQSYERNYAHTLWDNSKNEIIAWAKEGLETLISNGGKYESIKSSEDAMQEWMTKSDPFVDFINDINDDCCAMGQTLTWNPEGKVERKKLYKFFNAWREEAIGINEPRRSVRKSELYTKILEHKCVKLTTMCGVRYFKGLSINTNSEF